MKDLARGRLAAIVMAVLLLVYLILIGQRAIMFIVSGSTEGVIIGVALIVMPIIGVWALLSELRFGAQSQRLQALLREGSELPVDALAETSNRRLDRAEADSIFAEYRADLEEDPDDWRRWFRLGLAYSAAGDRRRARQSVRKAISLEATKKP